MELSCEGDVEPRCCRLRDVRGHRVAELTGTGARGPGDRRHGATGDDGARLADGGIGRGRPLIAMLDQQPLASTTRAHQDPAAGELLAEEHELELALGQLAVDIGLVAETVPDDRGPDTVVPDHHGPAAVLPLGDDAFELVVLDRVRLRLHREPLDGGVEGRPLGHRPREHDAAMLETEVVVQLAGPVLLDDELQRSTPGARASRRAPGGLGSDREAALAIVLGQPTIPAEISRRRRRPPWERPPSTTHGAYRACAPPGSPGGRGSRAGTHTPLSGRRSALGSP